MDWLRLLEINVYNLYIASITNECIDSFLHEVKIGDWVLEISTIHMDERLGRFGKLIALVEEPMGEGIYRETYILALPNGEQSRWQNALFIKVPLDIRPWE